jgi:hypothetical protein
MKSEARRQQELSPDETSDLPPVIDPASTPERPVARNGRHYPVDDDDEGAGKKRIQI